MFSETIRDLICIAGVMVLIGYIIICYVHNRLPCAPKGTVAVLFVIAAENDKVFESVRYKLVEQFESIVSVPDCSHFDVLCVRKEKIPEDSFSNKQRTLELLKRTNCLFFVDVKYSVDDADNAENFEMSIHYGTVHPAFDEWHQRLLVQDMGALRTSVGKHRFVKAEKIEVFNFTAYALSYISQYILGFVCLLSGNANDALVLLENVKSQLARESRDNQTFNLLRKLVPNRLYVAYMQLAKNGIANFQRTKGNHYLRLAQDSLAKANRFCPDTYDYNLLTAYIAVALDQDFKLAKACVEKCMGSKDEQTWKYSDAFLAAYQGYAPSTIISKYKRAFAVPYHGMLDLADYVEYIVEKEPERISLHLAAGLVYEDLGDARLMKKHFSIYLGGVKKRDSRVEAQLKSKMTAMPCMEKCENNCQVCSEQNVG